MKDVHFPYYLFCAIFTLEIFIGSLFSKYLDVKSTSIIFDLILCYSVDFVPFVFLGLLKVASNSGALLKAKSVEQLKQVYKMVNAHTHTHTHTRTHTHTHTHAHTHTHTHTHNV